MHSKSPVEIFIRGDEDIANPPILTINNQAIRYRLKLIKTDAKTGKTVRLANTAVKLLDSDGNVVTQTVSYPTRREIDTFYTDDNGEVTLPETVTRGMYFIEEVHAPQGYLICTERLGVFVGETGDAPGEAYTLDIKIPNEPVVGRVMVEKKGLRLVRLAEQTDAFGNIVHQPYMRKDILRAQSLSCARRWISSEKTGRSGFMRATWRTRSRRRNRKGCVEGASAGAV